MYKNMLRFYLNNHDIEQVTKIEQRFNVPLNT